MTKNTQYQKLSDHFQQIYHFEHFSSMGSWDQATMMPKGGNSPRSAAMATLSKHIHQMQTADWLADTIAQAEDESLTKAQQANLKEIKHQYLLSSAVNGDLVEAKSLAANKCEHAWREQRNNNDWQGFKPNLEAVIKLTREEAQTRSEALNISPYDALLNKFEPGINTAQLESLFNPLALTLPSLIKEVMEKQKLDDNFSLTGIYDINAQEALNRHVMELMGFDFNHGRLDISSHPFTGGVPGDVRLTTRFDETDFTSALMGTVHETGHALYEQGLPIEFRGQPAGNARSMGVHESQSLFCEMQLGRGQGFLHLMRPLINRHLNQKLTQAQLQNLYTRVKPNLIRVDADEVTYPCHIFLRFEAEKALVDGSLDVVDLPDFWSSKMQSLLGINTDGNYSDGCMQDIHWTLGELGYFPSYTLGSMIAAQLRFAIEKQLGNLDELIKSGQIGLIFNWLKHNVWSKGSLLSTDELLTSATGEGLNSQYFEKHLRQRYLK